MGVNEKVYEGHEGHDISFDEYDMGGDWDQPFDWCNDCEVEVGGEDEEV